MNDPKNSTAKVWRLLLIPMFFNMLVCAYSGDIGWMLFWAIAFSGGAYDYGYEYGKTEQRVSSQSPCRIGLKLIFDEKQPCTDEKRGNS
jgi:hypothetical protein